MDPTPLLHAPYGPRFGDGVRQEPSMRRRTFMALVSGGLLAAPRLAVAQPPSRVPRIGILSIANGPSALQGVFRQELRALGYVDGQSIALEWRWAGGQFDRLPVLAGELVRLKVDVIVAPGEPAIRAASQATSTIPIVMAVISDPVAAGFVKSLARPGGNLTGLTNLGSGLGAKRLELLKEAVPRLSRVALLHNPAKHSLDPLLWNESQAAAHVLGATPLSFEVRRPEEFEGAFASMKREHIDGLVVLPDSFFFNHRTRIVELEARNRIPAMHDTREYVDATGFMSYGPSLADLWRRAAGYVDKVLKGAKPADLPVEQPTKFELVINLKTAKALGLTIPPSLLGRADEVIQ